ncbi:MAG: UDP-N-acetylmuramoyl-tripeptide--D-alanyl-D-alanine ligase [Butyrivibrio sp.]|nr:UDP-N-acetylmuramoyl-tripeptide--D-alanyl-D-alanine ligase [Butyrivibrio sp.]
MLLHIITDTILLLAGLAGLILAGRVYLHLLQLSSYQFAGYFRTLKSRISQYGLHTGLLVLAVGRIYCDQQSMEPPFWLKLLILVFQLFLLLQYKPRQEKKPFVVTARIKRLMAMLVVLFLISFGIGSGVCAVQPRFLVGAVWVTLLWLAILPLFVAFGAVLMVPIEKMINNWYIHDAWRRLAAHPGLRIIGITGSYGKTSMKTALATLLSEGYRVLATPASYNTPMGVVRTIREQLTQMHEIFLCEMGARHVHDIRELTDIVHPDDGILTAIGEQHLETFGSLERITATKYELFDAVWEKRSQAQKVGPASHLMLANIDSEPVWQELCARKYPPEAGVITYGFREEAAYRAQDVHVTPEGTDFTVSAPDGSTTQFHTKLMGRHNVINITGAIAMSHELGIPMKKLAAAVRRVEGAEHRLQLVRQSPQVSILDDAYNSNPAGAKAALEVLSLMGDSDGRLKILVTPGMVELGDRQAALNRVFGEQAAAVCDHILIVGKTNAQAIKEGTKDAGFSEERLHLFGSFAEAAQEMVRLDAGRSRVILLENDLPDDYK